MRVIRRLHVHCGLIKLQDIEEEVTLDSYNGRRLKSASTSKYSPDFLVVRYTEEINADIAVLMIELKRMPSLARSARNELSDYMEIAADKKGFNSIQYVVGVAGGDVRVYEYKDGDIAEKPSRTWHGVELIRFRRFLHSLAHDIPNPLGKP